MKYEQRDGKNFDFLIGKSIVKVEEKQIKDEYGFNVDGYVLTCKDGTIIEIATNEGCGGCGNGWSSFDDLKKLEDNNNVITNIEVKYAERYEEDYEFTMFIYYEDNTINLLKGDDGYGNGYYGGGFYVTIKNLEKEENYMGTRSTIKFITKRRNEKLPHEYDYTPLVSVYQQWDGYVEGVGYDLANYLKSKKIINGISYGQNTDEYANGFECLIAQFIRDFKKDVGGFYITDLGDVEEYNYEVIFDEDKYFLGDYDTIDDLITIKVDSCPNFEGTPSELLAFKESDEDEEE